MTGDSVTVTTIRDPVVVSNYRLIYIAGMSLRDKVEELLPNWERWYPSLFDAASDLGIIKARVCDPNSLLLSNRHASVRAAAELEHRRRWSAEENEPED